MRTDDEIREVKRRHSPDLLKKPGVCGLDIDADQEGRPVIAIHLDTDDPSAKASLPRELEGYKVVLIKSGPYRKY